MSIFEDIKGNTATDLNLSVPADEVTEDIHEFFKALGANRSIESVNLSEDFIGDLRSESRSELLSALGSIPTLKEVHLADGLLMIQGVGEMVMNAKSLKVLSLKNIVLQGNDEHFKACESALYQHPNLKEFEMIDCDAALKDMAGKKCGTGSGSIADPVHHAQSAKSA
jgi:Ran GTPase-activating protein (RanGAP) involved in mRNA processing and transport